MVLLVHLRHLTLLLGEDISSLPQQVLIERIKALFSFLGEVGKVEIFDDTVQLHLREATPQKSAECAKLAERATKRAREGDYLRAIELLRRALQLSPSLPTLHRDLAMCLMELGQHAAAKDALIDALKLDATDAWSFVVLGNLYAKHEANPDQARRFYERALELKPGDAWALNGLASALAESGDQSGALLRFDEAIQSNPEFANAWLGKALLQLRSEQPRESAGTIRSLFAQAKMQDARSEPVFAEASKIFLAAESALAQSEESAAFKAVETYRRTVELDSGYPVEVSEDDLPSQTAGRAQMAWKHSRDRHLITSRRGLPPPFRDTLSHMNLLIFVLRPKPGDSDAIASSPPRPSPMNWPSAPSVRTFAGSKNRIPAPTRFSGSCGSWSKAYVRNFSTVRSTCSSSGGSTQSCRRSVPRR